MNTPPPPTAASLQTASQSGLPATLPGETPWFAGHALPVQEGVYRRGATGPGTFFSLWLLGRWHTNSSTVDEAAAQVNKSLSQRLPWCGLSAPPDGGYRVASDAFPAAKARVQAPAAAQSHGGTAC